MSCKMKIPLAFSAVFMYNTYNYGKRSRLPRDRLVHLFYAMTVDEKD